MGRYSLTSFIREMQGIVERTRNVDEVLAQGAPRLRRLIRTPDVLPPKYMRVLGRGPRANHGSYNIYRGPGLFVSVSVWGPGDHIDPHDHQSWGLVGIVENAIQETRYGVLGEDDRGLPRIERRDARLVQQGDVSILRPGDEIHELDNFSDAPTVEIHVYGKNLVGLERFRFDRTTGLASRMCSGPYDNC